MLFCPQKVAITCTHTYMFIALNTKYGTQLFSLNFCTAEWVKNKNQQQQNIICNKTSKYNSNNCKGSKSFDSSLHYQRVFIVRWGFYRGNQPAIQTKLNSYRKWQERRERESERDRKGTSERALPKERKHNSNFERPWCTRILNLLL